MKYKHVLLAVNFDANAEYLVMKAVEQARAHDALLSVIHIDPDFTELYEGVRDFNPTAVDDSVHIESVRAMNSLLKGANYPINKHIFYAGYVEDQIIKAIKEFEIDLLVFGHHESSWFHQLTLSSSEPLLRRMPCDLLFVRVER
ncbi:universal stress protein (plasmid) [Photobacterium sp. DA100]|uniref:universal stress protein n=1 Tax=Photobacterium sp. DA100 TaxID=3027472 RepID=UPI002479680A|nr:universal stress protein [Photobacterium sp. DA100]WEM45412.1 universal stress protein [Photobacterium sp. DA100]